MGQIYICDLCKKPLSEKDHHKYRVKRRDASLADSWWTEIDVHDECVDKVLKEVLKQEAE